MAPSLVVGMKVAVGRLAWDLLRGDDCHSCNPRTLGIEDASRRLAWEMLCLTWHGTCLY